MRNGATRNRKRQKNHSEHSVRPKVKQISTPPSRTGSLSHCCVHNQGNYFTKQHSAIMNLREKLKSWLQAVGGRQRLDAQKIKLNHTRDRAAATPDIEISFTIIAACNKSTIMVIPAEVSNKSFLLTIDPGTEVNILSEDAYKAVKRNSPLETIKINFTLPHRFLDNQKLWTPC